MSFVAVIIIRMIILLPITCRNQKKKRKGTRENSNKTLVNLHLHCELPHPNEGTDMRMSKRIIYNNSFAGRILSLVRKMTQII